MEKGELMNEPVAAQNGLFSTKAEPGLKSRRPGGVPSAWPFVHAGTREAGSRS